MLSALAKAVAQLSDPRIQHVLGRGIWLAVIAFLVLWLSAWAALGWLGHSLPQWWDFQEIGFPWSTAIEWLFGAAVIASMIIASFLLFPAVIAIAFSLLLDKVAQAVEDRHYPRLPPPRDQPTSEAIVDTARLGATTLLLNLLALPLYILLSFLPPLNLFVFYGVNGYLLSREYFELVAVRRLTRSQAQQLRRANQGYLSVAGVILALMLTVPVINLVTPVVAVSFMVHVFEGLRFSSQR